MSIAVSINRAYASFYRSPDLTAPARGGRFSSTDEACAQTAANLVYRAVEGLPPHQRALLRLCFTEIGTEIDAMAIYLRLWQDFCRGQVVTAWGPKRIAQLTVVAMLAIRNFPRLATAGRDELQRRDFAQAVGVGTQYYQDTLFQQQKTMELILAAYLGDALDPVKDVLKQQKGKHAQAD